ncbi:hypothetical protein D3C80_2028900 [compost metagenome]
MCKPLHRSESLVTQPLAMGAIPNEFKQQVSHLMSPVENSTCIILLKREGRDIRPVFVALGTRKGGLEWLDCL